VVGGQVDMMFDAVTTMAPMAKEGKVRGLATTGKKGTDGLPAVADTVPNYEATIWLGLMAPKGTPDAIVQKLNAEIRRIVAQPDVKKAWAEQGAVPMSMSTAEFKDYLNQDIRKWAEIVKVSGARQE
jgi:tripartite-type tricarboxylate transporter receptor subunit TctC